MGVDRGLRPGPGGFCALNVFIREGEGESSD